jgi:hypothetical protein
MVPGRSITRPMEGMMMTRRKDRLGPAGLIATALLVLLVVLPMGVSAAGDDGKDFFSIVVLPDTQYYSMENPEVFKAQTQWIRDNAGKENILFVFQLGDITNNNVQVEWDRADAAISLLDGVVPYSLAVGNHDMGHVADSRDMTLYNKTFPTSRYEHSDWYGGHMEGGNQNHYCFFEFGDLKFMTISLEFGPTDEVLEWAGGIVAAHPDRLVILTTHCYMNCDDTLVGDEDSGRPQDYAVGGNDGVMIWDKLVKKYDNIFLVMSGHIVCGESAARLISRRDDGSRVIQLLMNYQDRPNGGNGWLRILKIYPTRKLIEVVAYSPYLDKFNDGARHSFVIRGYDISTAGK